MYFFIADQIIYLADFSKKIHIQMSDPFVFVEYILISMYIISTNPFNAFVCDFRRNMMSCHTIHGRTRYDSTQKRLRLHILTLIFYVRAQDKNTPLHSLSIIIEENDSNISYR